MTVYQPRQYSSALKQAIDRNPIAVTPDTSVTEVIRLMGQLHCSYPLPQLQADGTNGDTDKLTESDETKASCVLVVQAETTAVSALENASVQGIVTEQEIVQLIATGMLDHSTEVRPSKMKINEVMSPSTVHLTQSEDQDIFTALSVFRQHQIHHLPVLDPNKHLVGVITPERIRQVLQPSNILRLRRVEDEMTRQPVTAPVTTSLLSLAQMMAAHQVNCVITYRSARHGKLTPIGIVTSRDLVLAQYLQLDLAQTSAASVTGTSLFTLKPDDSLWVAHQEMQQRQVERLIVCGEQGELLGMISQMSLLRMIDPTEMFRVVRNLQHSVDQLQAEKVELLENKAAQLEDQVLERTAKLYEQLQRERLLAKISFQIHQTLNLEEILETTVAEVRQVLSADRVVIYRVASNRSGKMMAESVGDDWRSLSKKALTPETVQYYIKAFETDSIVAISDVEYSQLIPAEIDRLQSQQIQAYLVVPLLQDGKFWGMITAHQCSHFRQWQTSETTLLQQLATQLAIAIQQAQLFSQIRDLNTDLERQVQERTAQLRQKVQELQLLNNLKDDFLSTVSHELRTPLSNMKMAIHMIKLVPKSDRFQGYVDILDKECAREISLINDLLDLQRLEASTTPISMEMVDLCHWLPSFLQSFYSRTQERDQTLQVDYPDVLPSLQTNTSSLERILAELLNNACKYSPNGGEICLSVEANLPSSMSSKKSGTYQNSEEIDLVSNIIRFSISNSASISEEELPKIFDKFYRVPNADPWKQGGTGLGLALVQKLVEQLQGTIKVSSGNNLTTFTVELPFN